MELAHRLSVSTSSISTSSQRTNAERGAMPMIGVAVRHDVQLGLWPNLEHLLAAGTSCLRSRATDRSQTRPNQFQLHPTFRMMAIERAYTSIIMFPLFIFLLPHASHRVWSQPIYGSEHQLKSGGKLEDILPFATFVPRSWKRAASCSKDAINVPLRIPLKFNACKLH